MGFHLRTLIPDKAVASSLLPIETAYRPKIVRFKSTHAMTARPRKMSTALGNLGISSLPFLGIVAGILCGCAVVIAHILITAEPPEMDADGKPIIIPEKRLPIMIIGSVLVPIGLFIFAWTSDPHIHWIGMAIGGFPIGMGMYMIFLQCFNYLIDSYLSFAASVFAANTILRSAIGAAFPLFTRQMFDIFLSLEY